MKLERLSRRRQPRTGLVIFTILSAMLLAVLLQRYTVTPVMISPTLQPAVTETAVSPKLDWPSYGQAAVATPGYGVIATHGSTKPQSTASTAKLITLLAVMKKRSFDDKRGADIIFNQDDVASYHKYVAGNGTTTKVEDGLKLTQYQAFQAVLLASSNNVSDKLANWAFGSHEQYRSYAQSMVGELGMKDTVIGKDASGYSPTTVSSAHDLAILALAVLKQPMITEITAQSRAVLPVAGEIHNSNRLLTAEQEVTGLKTGYIPEAGGVFVLSGKQQIDGHKQTIVTVVMGAPDTSSHLAQAAAYELYQSAKAGFSWQTLVFKGETVGQYQAPWQSAAVEIVAADDISAFVWLGSQPKLNIDAKDVKYGEKGKVGRATAVVGSQTFSAPVVSKGEISPPPLQWRLLGR